MNFREAMSQLKAKGTAQNRKIYTRHGVGGEMFGVSYADLGKMKKQIKVDHVLAIRLWNSHNHDARVLASMVADPEALDSKTMDAWVKDLDCRGTAAAFADLCACTRFAGKKMAKWTASRQEWIGYAGWGLVARLALDDAGTSEEQLAAYLGTLETDMPRAKNWVRYAMNNALIAIALRSARLEKKAVAAARRIGKVEVDVGETSCKVPDAIPYIAKARAHRARMKKAAGKESA